MEHKDSDVEEVINQMLQDRRKNPNGRIDREKYVKKGHPQNEVRKAAETASEIWPILDKYGNIIESEVTIRKLQESYRLLEEKVFEQERRIQEHEEGKPEREELARKVRELERQNQEGRDRYQKAMKELESLRSERSYTTSVDVREVQWRLKKQQEDISRLNGEAIEGIRTIAEMRRQLEQKDGYIKNLKEKNDLLNEAGTRAESAYKEQIGHERSRFRMMFSVETAVLAILLVLLFVGHGMDIIARGMIIMVRLLTATMISDIHSIISSLKLIALGALHYVELHLSLLIRSLFSFLRPVAIFFLIVLLIFLIASIANKR
ncbi:MAG: hypothetical protein ACP5UZ_07620 [Thermoplasmata archaeon]